MSPDEGNRTTSRVSLYECPPRVYYKINDCMYIYIYIYYMYLKIPSAPTLRTYVIVVLDSFLRTCVGMSLGRAYNNSYK